MVYLVWEDCQQKEGKRMIRMIKQEKIRAVLQLAIWILPIPFGAFVSDRSFFAPLSLLVFLVLSLSMPVTMRLRQMKRHGSSIYAPVGSILYGSIIILLIAIGILNGLMSYSFWQEYIPRVLVFTAWMIGTVICQSAASWGIACWQKHTHRHWYSEFLDPVLYSFPLPCALMGMLLFPAIAGNITQSLIIGMLGIIGFGFMAIGIIAVAVMAFYFFPKKELPRKERCLQVLRIIWMVLVWASCLYLLFMNDAKIFSTVVFQCMPISQNNILVFITPFVTASVLLVASIAVSNVIMMGIRNMI